MAQPEQLVELYVGDASTPYQAGSYQDFLIFRNQPEIFSGLAAYNVEQFKLGGAEDVEQVWGEAVSGNYFELLGVHAFKSRMFLPEEDQTPGTHPVAVISHDFDERDRDGAPGVAVVNESFERRYFADGRALGKHLKKFESPNVKLSCEIVGVVRDDRVQSLQKEPLPWYAFPLRQSHATRMVMLVQPTGAPQSLVPTVRCAIQSLDRDIPVSDVLTLNETCKPFLFMYRLFGIVVGACGVLAVLLASMGIYGTVSYVVAQRTREIGIRWALGAGKQDILGLLIRQGMIRVVYGLSLGLLLVTLLACYIPARVATKVDPLVALRYE